MQRLGKLSPAPMENKIFFPRPLYRRHVTKYFKLAVITSLGLIPYAWDLSAKFGRQVELCDLGGGICVGICNSMRGAIPIRTRVNERIAEVMSRAQRA